MIKGVSKRKIGVKDVAVGLKKRRKLIGFYGSEEKVSYGENTVTKSINGYNLTYYTEKLLKYHAETYKHYKDHMDRYTKVAPGWYIQNPPTNGAWATMAGIKQFDWAVPYEWQKKNQAEVTRRGGAVWWYDKDHRWGEPLFMDEIKKMAMKNIKEHAPR